METYLGIDLGTSILKITAINKNGTVLASVAKSHEILTPAPGFAEENPEHWWKTTVTLLKQLGGKIDLDRVRGIGLSGQMHGVVFYDSSNSILNNAIIWLDKRSQREVEAFLESFGGKKIYRITGNPLFTGFLLPSVMWIKKHKPELYKKIATISSPKDFLVLKLTGVLRSEPSDALATGAFDYDKNAWSKKILEASGIPFSIFPPVFPTNTPYGKITTSASKLTGLSTNVLVYGGSDQAMAAMGVGLVEEGTASLAISTGGQFLVVAKKGIQDPKRRLHTLNHALPNIGLYMAATLSAGLSLQWFKDNVISYGLTYSGLLRNFDRTRPGGNGLFYFPFLAGERTPYFNTRLKASFIGLSLEHTRPDLVRAIIEGVAYSMRECLQTFHEVGIDIKSIRLSGGGTRHPAWAQVLADVLQKPLELITIADHSPFGAAVFARFAETKFTDLATFYKQKLSAKDIVTPNASLGPIYDQLYTQYKKHASYLNKHYKS